MREHYNPHEIHYDRDSIIWIIEHIQYDSWPRPASNYTDPAPDIQRQPNQSMPNRAWIETVAEVKRRLKLCGPDGLITLSHLGYNNPLWLLALMFKLPETEIERRIKRAINYISWGHNIKKCKRGRGSYREWCERAKARAVRAARVRWAQNHAKCMLDV